MCLVSLNHHMKDVIDRLHRTKLVLSCLSLAVAGGAFIMIGQRATTGWVSWIPWSEFGGVLVGAGILSIGLDQYLRREQDTTEEMRLRSLLSEQAPALRDAVLDAFAANHSDLKRIATPQLLDDLIANSLALRLDDQQFAQEIYADIRDQAIAAAERWHDATLDIRLEALLATTDSATEADAHPPGAHLFAVTVRWEYTTIPTHAHRQFVCLSDRDEYSELTSERGSTSAWFINPDSNIDPSAPDTFKLLHFAINGEERPIRRSARKTAQTYTASIGIDRVNAGKPVTVTYTYRAIMTQSGHLLFFDIEQPTRDLQVSFDYRDCDISSSVSTLDMIPSIRETRIETPVDTGTAGIIRVALDGWIFPRSGIAFVWTLRSELARAECTGRNGSKSLRV